MRALKAALKTLARGLFLTCALGPAALSGFGAWKTAYVFWAQACALVPGIVGDYLRAAFYHLTLAEASISSRISFGSYFAHPEAKVGSGAYIGSYCIIGKAAIGSGAQIASGVQILSGRHQHARDADGSISGAERGAFETVAIGAHAWIGAAAVVMADVGEGSTVGAGAVVSRPIPPGCVAAGNPARVIRTLSSGRDEGREIGAA